MGQVRVLVQDHGSDCVAVAYALLKGTDDARRGCS
jgi:hypothetical protein